MLTKFLMLLCLGLFGAPAASLSVADTPALVVAVTSDAVVTYDQVATTPMSGAPMDAVLERAVTRTAIDPSNVYAMAPREPDRWLRHAISPDSGVPMDNRPLAPPNRLA